MTDAENTEAPQTLAAALLAFQADPPEVVKQAEAEIKDKGGKKLYSYKYLSLQGLLEAVRPKFIELGLLWSTRPVFEEGKPGLYYELMHVPSGQDLHGTMPLIAGGTMQALGGSITFARRYALVAVLNLAPDVDDDSGQATREVEGIEKITKRMAEQIVAEAEQLGLRERLQLAGSHVHGSDVGDCSTKAKAVKAMQELTTDEAERLLNKLATLGAPQPEQEG